MCNCHHHHPPTCVCSCVFCHRSRTHAATCLTARTHAYTRTSTPCQNVHVNRTRTVRPCAECGTHIRTQTHEHTHAHLVKGSLPSDWADVHLFRVITLTHARTRTHRRVRSLPHVLTTSLSCSLRPVDGADSTGLSLAAVIVAVGRFRRLPGAPQCRSPGSVPLRANRFTCVCVFFFFCRRSGRRTWRARCQRASDRETWRESKSE